jgi:Dyp-type peroxidase family
MRDDGRKFSQLPAWLRQTISLPAAIERFHDVQPNLLRRGAYSRVAYAFAQLPPGRLNEAVRWLVTFTARYVQSCSAQLSGIARAPWGNVSLSASAYRKLGLQPPNDRSFRGGMKQANLNDSDVSEWAPPFREDLDILVSLAGNNEGDIEQALSVLDSLRLVTDCFHIEQGAELPRGVEHFGFLDGISQPVFVEEDLSAGQGWSAATPLQAVLARDPYGATDNSYGSYAVFRKLHQDVARFQEGVRRMATTLGVTEELAGAMVIGRFKDGTPLALASEPGHGPVNSFTYDSDRSGSRCPFAAHIRRSNPRGALDDVAHAPDWQSRIVRRSIPYGRPGESEVGLLFLCYQSDIGAQFELIQNNWCNFPHFPVLRIGRDPLIGQKNSWDHFEEQAWPSPDERDGIRRFGFPQCVELRGGEYFFAPSLSFLTGLCSQA